MRPALLALALTALLVAPTSRAASVSEKTGLPAGVIRGPLLHEHSFQTPLVDDWWEEGVPHYMIGGAAIANEKFLRLTGNRLNNHGFAFNTAPMDHDNWEVRMHFSVRPPPPAVLGEGAARDAHYQGGDGLALWYLPHPIGDDHQHVVKYSKSLSPEIRSGLLDRENPWRLADQLLNAEDDEEENEEDFDEDVDDITEEEKQRRAAAKERRAIKRQQREELFRRVFKRGTSIDDTEEEERIFGVKYSDFPKGFAILLDSVGDEAAHLAEHKAGGTAPDHHHHKATISLLLNLPNHTHASGATIQNNFNPAKENFRRAPKLLQCEYDFRQKAYRRYVPTAAGAAKDNTPEAEVARRLAEPEEPVELVVRYYKNKLSVIIEREDVAKREVISPSKKGAAAAGEEPEIRRTYVETLCGELYPVYIPQKYHFGLSAATGRVPKADQKRRRGNVFEDVADDMTMHVDVHDVFRFELRELGLNAKEMGYSKSIPIEHFDYEGDRRQREHFSRQIPVEPDADV